MSQVGGRGEGAATVECTPKVRQELSLSERTVDFEHLGMVNRSINGPWEFRGNDSALSVGDLSATNELWSAFRVGQLQAAAGSQ